jgi:glycosyltransferase involved in cell wall biosynthesis
MNRSLRFCMITTFYPPWNFGGDGIFVWRLANELAQRGHQVEIIHCIDAYHLFSPKEPTGTYQNHPNVTVHGLKSRFGFFSPLGTQQTGFPLFKSTRIQKILKNRFDVIHYHNISLVGGPKILEYGQGIKLYTMHEYWLVCPMHVLLRFHRSICTRRSCFVCQLAYGRPPQWWRYFGLLKSAVRHVDAFLAPSRFARDKHVEMGLDVPIVHLPPFISSPQNGVPGSEDGDGGKRSGKPYFLFAGRLEKLKGLHTLIDVFLNYRETPLMIAGTGSCEPGLRKMAGGSPNIRFLGHRSGHDLLRLYREAVALIVPSINFEISSLVVFEAFSQKTPVIARDLGGIAEPIEESGGGFTYNTDDELRERMDELLANPTYRRELGLRGYQAYQQNWTAEVHLKRYLRLIDEIAAARAGHV